MGAYISLVVAVALLAAAIGAVAGASSRGTLARNDAVGIRTKATKSSDAAWDAGHRAAVPAMRATAWFGAATVLIGVVVAFIVRPGETPGAEITVPVVGFLGEIVGTVAAARVADRAARTALG